MMVGRRAEGHQQRQTQFSPHTNWCQTRRHLFVSPLVITPNLTSPCFSSISKTCIRKFWRRYGSVNSLWGFRRAFSSSWSAVVRCFWVERFAPPKKKNTHTLVKTATPQNPNTSRVHAQSHRHNDVRRHPRRVPKPPCTHSPRKPHASIDRTQAPHKRHSWHGHANPLSPSYSCFGCGVGCFLPLPHVFQMTNILTKCK